MEYEEVVHKEKPVVIGELALNPEPKDNHAKGELSKPCRHLRRGYVVTIGGGRNLVCYNCGAYLVG